MRTIYIFAAAALCGLALTTSCEKDNENELSGNAVEIFVEGSGAKTTVNGTSVKWVEGDRIWINGAEGTVARNGNHWYADGSFSTNSDFNSFYPATLVTATGAENQTDAIATVVFPSHYSSSFDGGNQVISLPLAARSVSGSTGVVFRHLSAGINEVVTNSTGDDLYIDSVSVSSSSINLCGQARVSLREDDAPSVVATGDGAKTVTVNFTTPVMIANDESKTIQVPVIPNTTGLGDLTVKVYSHQTMANSSILYLTYTKTKSSAPGLGRNAVASLAVSMSADGAELEKSVLGAFTVALNDDGTLKKIYFSHGNLQYKMGEAYPWRFAPNQYDCVGAWNTSDWVDLFGWGTWTGNEVEPLRTPYDYTKYSWNTDDFVKESELADASQRGYNWRTLSSKEWEYVLNIKDNNGRGDEYRFAKAMVTNNKIPGLILFPDDFVLPTGMTINKYNKVEANFNTNVFSDAEWSLLEAEGCVFLPAAGCRKVDTPQELGKMGGYHSSTEKPVMDDNKMRFDNTSLVPAKNGGKMWGNSVRLVRGAN